MTPRGGDRSGGRERTARPEPLEPPWLRELLDRRRRKRERGDRVYRLLTTVFFAALLVGVLGFVGFLAEMVAPALLPYG